MNILVTCNEHYIHPLKVMLKSLFVNNGKESFSIYIVYSNILDQQLKELKDYVESEGHKLHPTPIDSKLFAGLPTFRHFTIEMYYRLAAHKVLPNHLQRILYLDPDIVVINSISELYWTEFGDSYFVASEHKHFSHITRAFNKLRLNTPRAHGYFNTGVLLMNLHSLRNEVILGNVFQYIKKNKRKLILPDQDVLNALYWDKVIPVDCYRFNYEARYYQLSKLIINNKRDLQWIQTNTVFIHYCGKKKPWKYKNKGNLGRFYLEYENLLLERT